MENFDIELRKLVAVTDCEKNIKDSYWERIERIAATFTSARVFPWEEDEKDALMCKRLAEETMFRALEMMLHNSLHGETDTTEQQDEYISQMAAKCEHFVDDWLGGGSADMRSEVTEDLMRRICFIVYGCCGGYETDFGTTNVYLFAEHDEQGRIYAAKYCTARLEDTLNMDEDAFLSEYSTFLDNAKCTSGQYGERIFDLWPANAHRVCDIAWNEIFPNRAVAVQYLEKAVGQLDERIKRKVRRMFKNTQTAPPVDVEQLKQDAATMEESVLTRMDMLAVWLASQQTLSQEYVAVREERDELKRRLDMANARLAVLGENHDKLGDECSHFNERIAHFEEEYDTMFRNFSDVMLENAELMDEKRKLERELEQAQASLDEKAQQLAAKKRSEREKVLQEQLDAANERMKAERESNKKTLAEANQTARKALIDEFISGLRKRCSRKDATRQEYLLDDLINSTWSCSDLQQAVHLLQDELQTQPSTDERMARAQEKMAEKPAVEIKDSTIKEFYEGQNG